jgi:DNA polymerase-3 subunit epsilon
MPNRSSNIPQTEPTADRRLPLKPDSFLALDVETANSNISSICQIAVVRFEVGKAVDIWHSFVNPGEPFAALNVAIHGINASTVQDAPDFSEVMCTISALLSGKVVVSHMPFDRIAVQGACSKYGISPIQCSWLDTAVVARRAWPRFARKGYGLKSVASWCGIEFCHHDAVEDAITAGCILSKAIIDTGNSLEHWLNDSTFAKVNDRRINDHDCLKQNRHSSVRYIALDARHFRTLSCLRDSRA